MIRLVAQRRPFDCGVACIAMVCHVDYSDAFFVAARIAGQRIRGGLTVTQMAAVALAFKRPLKRVDYRRVDVDEDSGVLGVLWAGPAWKSGHWVVLRRGTIIDPEGLSVWDADEYLKTHKARVGTLLAES